MVFFFIIPVGRSWTGGNAYIQKPFPVEGNTKGSWEKHFLQGRNWWDSNPQPLTLYTVKNVSFTIAHQSLLGHVSKIVSILLSKSTSDTVVEYFIHLLIVTAMCWYINTLVPIPNYNIPSMQLLIHNHACTGIFKPINYNFIIGYLVRPFHHQVAL